MVFRCNVKFTVDVVVESVCKITLVLPSANVSITPDAGFAVTLGMEANRLDTINKARITERVALDEEGSRVGGMRCRTISGG